MPTVLIVLGFGLVAAGLYFAFGGLAGDRAGGGARDIRLEGPAWLILVALGVAVIVFGVWRYEGAASDRPDPSPTPTTELYDPFTFGDDAYLDDLWLACSAGDYLACDDLYLIAPLGSDYELYGASCGGLLPGSLGGLESSGRAGACSLN